MKISGVYKITSPSGKMYIGSSVNIKARWQEHKKDLRHNRHHSPLLQKVWDKYPEQLKFEILFECLPENRFFYEQICLDLYQPEYNCCKLVGVTTGRKLSEEHKAKISARSKLQKLSPEHIEKLRKSRIGWKMPEKQKENLRRFRRGLKASAELKAKLSAAHKGRKHSEESKRKMAISRLGRKLTIMPDGSKRFLYPSIIESGFYVH